MERFQIDDTAERSYEIRVEEVRDFRPDLVRTLIEIDLQTFSESTFSQYTAVAFLKHGTVFLLSADDVIIGTCACFRSWDSPNEVTILTMGIRPGWRGRGLGQEFVVEILGLLRARGIRSVSLLVSHDNRRAVSLYRESGFEIDEHLPQDPRTGESFLMMRCQLREETPIAELVTQ